MARLSKFLVLGFILMIIELHSLVSICSCFGLNLIPSLTFIFPRDKGHHLCLALPIPLNYMTYSNNPVAVTSSFVSHLRWKETISKDKLGL